MFVLLAVVIGGRSVAVEYSSIVGSLLVITVDNEM